MPEVCSLLPYLPRTSQKQWQEIIFTLHVAALELIIKQEIPVAKADPQNAISQFYVNPQRQPQTAVVAPPQALLTTQGTAQLLLPLSIQGPNSTTSVQLPVGNIKLQVWMFSFFTIKTHVNICLT